jgi:hypothetical protein
MRGFWKNRKGYVMAYVTILIGTISIPMLILSVEIVRAMYVEVQLQAAVDAACEAAIQAVDVSFFIHNGVLQIDLGAASTYAQREFNATVINHNIINYNPSLSGISLLTPTLVQCSSSATIQWLLPGIPALTLHANSLSQARVSL